jgi:DNA-binding CsgD family transcriptional regulator/tetratricopeptide (TPR) repeat protein
MTTSADLDLARAAFDRRAWKQVADRLAAAEAADRLEIEDLERLSVALHMLGRSGDSRRVLERAHLVALRAGDRIRAARHAFYLVMSFGEEGEYAQAGGWHARATRLLDEAGEDCVERAMLLIPAALLARDEGRPAESLALFDQVAAAAHRFHDPDLQAMASFGRGETLIALGEVERGVSLLDEAMVAVTAGEVEPINVGIVYCGSIEAYQAVFELGRAQEWTAALTRWCDSQPDAVPFRGRCLVYRSEILRIHGRWADAVDEVGRARDWLLRPPPKPAVGEAYYLQGELHRLRGEFDAAESAYRDGATWGRRPDPGLALVRLAQGDHHAAAASLRRALDEADPIARPRLLEPFVEVMLAAGDVEAAEGAARELAAIGRHGAQPPLLRAIAARADGLVKLAKGDAKAALVALRSAWELWQTLDAPYESARARVAIARACQALGDADGAAIELATARKAFEELGALPDRDRVDALAGSSPAAPGGLSPRELEVLRLVAGGGTNRDIATNLGISERTVDRHVSNIFTKLDVSSRAAATAFAYEHRLV